HIESWATLTIELVLPGFVFGPRPLKLLCFVAFTAFQLANLATANYGFFVYLTLALHVCLLSDRDLARLAARLPWRPRLPRAASSVTPPAAGWRAAGATIV